MKPGATSTDNRQNALRRTPRFAATFVTVALVIAWAVLLRPTFLGGPVSYVLVAGESMEPTLSTGDLALLRRQPHYGVGDVISYHVPKGEPGAGALIIHRIIGGSAGTGYRLQGDNRERPDLWRPRPAEVEGRMWLSLPSGGRLFAFARHPVVMATIAALLTVLMIGKSPTVQSHRGRTVTPGSSTRRI